MLTARQEDRREDEAGVFEHFVARWGFQASGGKGRRDDYSGEERIGWSNYLCTWHTQYILQGFSCFAAVFHPKPMTSANVDSLIRSFAVVPSAAIPAIVDCVLASVPTLSASQLFFSLIDALPDVLQDRSREDGVNVDSSWSKEVISFLTALFHLVECRGSDAMGLLVWRGVMPVLQAMNPDDKELLLQVEEMLCKAISSRSCWEILEETLVLFCLRSIGIQIGKIQSEAEAVFSWSKELEISYHEYKLDGSVSLPMPVACHTLASILDFCSGAKSRQRIQVAELGSLEELTHSEIFTFKLVHDLTQVVTNMLSQCFEHRSCAVRFLLPSIFRRFPSLPASRFQGIARAISLHSFSRRIWKCCLSLFSLGKLERQDAYNILSLFFNIPGKSTGNQNAAHEMFDVRHEREFWEEIQKGLVDKDATTRKISLYILKLSLGNEEVLQESQNSQFSTSDSVKNGLMHISNGASCCYDATRGGRCIENSLINISNGTTGGSDATRRGRWANKEAKSLGVGAVHTFSNNWNALKRWKVFFLLYEMLDEYGTHLVEAAWTHQVDLLFQSGPCDKYISSLRRDVYGFQMDTVEGMLGWLTVLWDRGFIHENPQVRCLILQSFLSVDWENHGSYAKKVPRTFIHGPLIQALNDVVHHKNFGLGGTYTSKTIEDASRFFHQTCAHFPKSTQTGFLYHLASVARQESFGRAGLMALAFCLSSAAHGTISCDGSNVQCHEGNFSDNDQVCSSNNSASELLEALRTIIERCKQHFNPKYRLEVCEQVLIAAYFTINIYEVPLDVLLHFISAIPREFVKFGGPLRRKVQEWLTQRRDNDDVNSDDTQTVFLKNLCNYPIMFVKQQHLSHISVSFDDEDLNTWVFMSRRWTRLFFLAITEPYHTEQLLMFLKDCGTSICKNDATADCLPVKFFTLVIALIEELQISDNIPLYPYHAHTLNKNEAGTIGLIGKLSPEAISIVYGEFQRVLLSILDELIKFAELACVVFWSDHIAKDTGLPGSVKGKLGGPSQRRLLSHTATIVLQAIVSMKCVASIFSWFTWLKEDSCHNSLFTFLWKFTWMVIHSPICNTETGSEIQVAAYEALVPVLKALSSAVSPLDYGIIRVYNKLIYQNEEDKPLLDPLLLSFLKSIKDLSINGILARSRHAVLMNWKWACLVSILSIPSYVMSNYGGLRPNSCALFSDSTLKSTLLDIIECLENASDASSLPMLRSVRLILGLLGSKGAVTKDASFSSLDPQVVEQLVHSSWILHISCNKRQIAPIAALLSSVLHPSLFCDSSMHEISGSTKGPIKWFVEQLLDEGTKSPRTIRLAACHLSGLWLLYPGTIKYYIKELKLLALHGSVAFDEDFEAELSENIEAKSEVMVLAQSPYSELTEAFINTEMYARVSVSILFHKLAEIADRVQDGVLDADAIAARQSGRMFLIELLDAVVNDNDLAKELYKKYSAVHRRKVRAWQMLCVLSRFVEDDIVQEVTSMLHICLYRCNLPAVRQYLETFSIHVYLKFPALIKKQLVLILRDPNMRPQALSSYVFIAANLITHAGENCIQLTHLNDLLPPIIPLLTSHHHSLRGFTQVLVYNVLSKLVPVVNSSDPDSLLLEKKCFQDLKSYLEENIDCVRLRVSMEGFFDSFDPKRTATPAGIFNARNEASGFECVPVSLMEQVVTFLNDVREELRCSMAKDVVTINNESYKANDDTRNNALSEERSVGSMMEVQKDSLMDFQKKLTLHKHEKQPISAIEKEDLLLDDLARSRCLEMKRLRESRQQFILVASLLDRIPNLAGLARTCEIFKASGLAVADASVVHDKQFQLISVTAEKWVPVFEVPVCSLKAFLDKKKREGFSVLGLEQTANSTPLDQFSFPTKTVLVLGREKEGIPVDVIHALDGCVEIPQLGTIRSLNVHVSGAIALWEYTRQHRCKST